MKIGIDFGTKNILVYSENKGITMSFPCVAAVQSGEDKVITIGDDAQKMIGRNSSSMRIIRPFSEGAISDFEITETLFRYVIKNTCKNSVMRPKVAITKPCVISSFEKAMLKKIAENAGARQVLVIDDALSAIIGSGVDISKPKGHLVADIGGGCTSIAVVTMGQIAKAKTIKTAGNNFDKAIQNYVKHKYGAVIGELTAEETKKHIGGVMQRQSELAFVVKGQSTQTGFPINAEINSTELTPILSSVADKIAYEIKQILETTEPELSADIYDSGLLLTGGGAMIYGIHMYLSEMLKIPPVPQAAS